MGKNFLKFLSLIVATSLSFASFAVDIAPNNYSLPVGMDDAERLTFQHNLALPVSEAHLLECGSLEGKVVFDVGAGGGDMTLVLAAMVGSGHVSALDESAEQIAVARAKVEKAGLSNVSFIHANIMDPQFATNFSEHLEKADLVFTRYLMMHLPNPDIAIQNIYLLLKAGGKWLSEETVIDGLRSNHAPEFIEIYKDFFKNLFPSSETYRSLPALAKQAGFSLIADRIEDRKVSPPDMKQIFLNHQKTYQLAIHRGKLTQEMLNGWWHIVSLVPEDAEIFLNGLHCLTATK